MYKLHIVGSTPKPLDSTAPDLPEVSKSCPQIVTIISPCPCLGDNPFLLLSARKCLLRSPHYPGMYPANLTCSYHVFVLPGEIPPGKQVDHQHGYDGGHDHNGDHDHNGYTIYSADSFTILRLEKGRSGWKRNTINVLIYLSYKALDRPPNHPKK